MARQLNWVFSENQVPSSVADLQSQNRAILLQLISFLVANGWSNYRGCNSTTVTAGDSWQNTPANLVWNTSGNAHSWQILESPTGLIPGANGTYTGTQSKMWLGIELLSSSSTIYYLFALHLWNSAPSGGSTTAVPTGSVSTGIVQWTLSPRQNTRINMSVTSGNATGNGAFIMELVTNNSTNGNTLLILSPAKNVKTLQGAPYAYPVFLNLGYGAQYGAVGLITAGNWLGFNHDGTAATAADIGYYLPKDAANNIWGSGLASNSLSLNLTANEATGRFYIKTANKACEVCDVPDIFIDGSGNGFTALTVNDNVTIEYTRCLASASIGAWIPSAVQRIVG